MKTIARQLLLVLVLAGAATPLAACSDSKSSSPSMPSSIDSFPTDGGAPAGDGGKRGGW